jgi:hypothetical protein
VAKGQWLTAELEAEGRMFPAAQAHLYLRADQPADIRGVAYSAKAIEVYVSRLDQKVGCHSRLELVLATEDGQLDLPPNAAASDRSLPPAP